MTKKYTFVYHLSILNMILAAKMYINYRVIMSPSHSYMCENSDNRENLPNYMTDGNRLSILNLPIWNIP